MNFVRTWLKAIWIWILSKKKKKSPEVAGDREQSSNRSSLRKLIKIRFHLNIWTVRNARIWPKLFWPKCRKHEVKKPLIKLFPVLVQLSNLLYKLHFEWKNKIWLHLLIVLLNVLNFRRHFWKSFYKTQMKRH